MDHPLLPVFHIMAISWPEPSKTLSPDMLINKAITSREDLDGILMDCPLNTRLTRS